MELRYCQLLEVRILLQIEFGINRLLLLTSNFLGDDLRQLAFDGSLNTTFLLEDLFIDTILNFLIEDLALRVSLPGHGKLLRRTRIHVSYELAQDNGFILNIQRGIRILAK